ncbi:MaoC family dehydratase [Microbacterium sp. W1N]|uniref:MaoC family dehydratase n=1 Tax=Microbacterium festucae TaxID=2977531 RepID=UPI0021BE1D3D|nr:MaoC family dehydratase [Microbacterium festucae]MCT9818905.1 MaoC family dehydratase [Microbacterium festucae]
MSIEIADPQALPDAVGRTATGDWFEVDQSRIDAFAAATEDRQWIHLDAERAATGPFGGTIAHGYLTLSLLPHLTDGLLRVQGLAMAVNYGLDKVRFLQPVRAGSRVRAVTEITAVDAAGAGLGGAPAFRVSARTTVEIDGADRPALVAETIALLVAA